MGLAISGLLVLRDAWWDVCGCGVRGHIVSYDECTVEQQLYDW